MEEILHPFEVGILSGFLYIPGGFLAGGTKLTELDSEVASSRSSVGGVPPGEA